MAVITQIRAEGIDHPKRHPTETECRAFSFETPDGETLLQLDTFGSTTRENPGKGSQTIQVNERAAAQLMKLITRAFPSLSG